MAATYHTHTFRCQHAEGDVIDYARAAVAAGLDALGASDHSPLPDGRWRDVRMRLDQLAEYEAAVALAREEVPGLRILLGMECDLGEAPIAFWEDYRARGYDFLIASCHYVETGGGVDSAFESCDTPTALRDYARRTVAGIASGLFDFVAHPDVFGCCNERWTPDCAAATRDICAAAVTHGIPLELNTLGLRRGLIDTPSGRRARYPWAPFWDIAAEHGCSVVINSDAHRPQDVAHGLTELAAFAAQLRLDVVDPLTPSPV